MSAAQDVPGVDLEELIYQLNQSADAINAHYQAIGQARATQTPLVRQLRAGAVTWESIARAMGMTRQTVWMRFRDLGL